jgi:hypothetical protein
LQAKARANDRILNAECVGHGTVLASPALHAIDQHIDDFLTNAQLGKAA